MTLTDNWKAILIKAWSIRLIILSGLLSGIEFAMPSIITFIEPLDLVPKGSFALLAVLVSASAAIARVIAQPQAEI